MVLTKQIICLFATISLSLLSCSGSEPSFINGYIPSPPDYSDKAMWVEYHNDGDGNGADIFYIPSTWEFDWTTPEGYICHYADVTNKNHRADMKTEMDGVADYMAVGNNFHSPYYRHITLDTWATLNEETINQRYADVSFVDVKNAFDIFMEERDDSRPFILAGFSQRGKSVVELLKILTPEQREKMVAAYVLGYKVTPEDVAAAPWIKGAEKNDDTGVVICYNSVSDVKYVKPIVAAPNVMSINPVNWRTDATPATLNDTITVTLDPEAKVLVLDGFDGSYLPNILNILNVGDYHGIEPWVYSECLRDNMHQRIYAYRQSKQIAGSTTNYR